MKSSIELDPLVPTEILIILLVVGAIIFIWDLLDRRGERLRAISGLEKSTEVVSLSGSSLLPGDDLFSKEIGLTSRPGGIIRDDNFLIPVEHSPLARKVQDRHVIQLLAHMRLIEATHGKRPPYGLLVLGPEARSVKIKNTDQKQQWLDTVLREMRGILQGEDSKPSPSYYKCKSCDSNEICTFSAFKEKQSEDGRREEGREERHNEKKHEETTE